MAVASTLSTSGAEVNADSLRPHAIAQPLPLESVHWTTGFWADRFDTCRQRSIPTMWQLMRGTEYKPFLENFRIAAGMAQGDHHGAPFNDGDFYKWIEAACAALAVDPDPTLRRWVDESVATIGKAQRSDGYIHTPVLIRQRNGDADAQPFQDRRNFEMYNMGHLMTAACLHHRVTGSDDFLDIARKTADFLYATFRNPTADLARNSVCPSHYMGIIDMYRETGEGRYLELARTFLAMREMLEGGTDDNQDRVPFLQQREAVGHAVRANYLFAGVADLYLETGDRELLVPLRFMWDNVASQKMYITGGCGALYDGASPDGSRDQDQIARIHQAYGRNYQLPNTTAHNETCANIGNVLWNWRMFLATGEAKFLDILELTLCNSVLSGVSLEGKDYSYVNPLRTTDPLPVPLRWSRSRVPFVTSYCCPPNVVRTVAQANGMAYAQREGELWCNLYGANELQTTINGGRLQLTQRTDYPWDGQVTIQIERCPTAEWTMKCRIPDWAAGAKVTVNRAPVDQTVVPGTFVVLTRKWHSGDEVQLDFPTQPTLIESHPLVEETRNQLAVRRGPIVYCLESLDLPPGVVIADVGIGLGAKITPRRDRNLLGDVVVLDAELLVSDSRPWTKQLYREAKPSLDRLITAPLVPYYAWGNRGAGEMTVWLNRVK